MTERLSHSLGNEMGLGDGWMCERGRRRGLIHYRVPSDRHSVWHTVDTQETFVQ